jgi:hypothetical protein
MLRLVIETDFDNEAAEVRQDQAAEVRQDQPVSFASDRRVFASRAVTVSLEPRPARGG